MDKPFVANGENLIEKQHVWSHVHRDAETKAHEHARRVGLNRLVCELVEFGKADDLLKISGDLFFGDAVDRTGEVDILDGVELGMEAGAEFKQRAHAAAHLACPFARAVNSGEHLQER